MKYLVVICVLALASLAMAGLPYSPIPTHSRGCIYVNGRCYSECEEGTHSYTTGCGRLLPEATCDQPEPVLGEGNICDYSACYCDHPHVRDSISNKCMLIENCPEKKSEHHHHKN